MYDLNNEFVFSFPCLGTEVALQQETQDPTPTEAEMVLCQAGPFESEWGEYFKPTVFLFTLEEMY